MNAMTILAACLPALQPAQDPGTLRGVLRHDPKLEGGVWTLAVDGRTYDLHGDLTGRADGDRVEVEGTAQPHRVCVHQVGVVFRVARIRLLNGTCRQGIPEQDRAAPQRDGRGGAPGLGLDGPPRGACGRVRRLLRRVPVMSDGVWIFLGLVALAVAILKHKGGAKAPPKNDVLDLYKQADVLAPDIVKECVEAARALPILDEKTHGLFHDPVYDAKVDQFDPPCKDNEFKWTWGKCWLSPDTLPAVFEVYADQEARFRLGLSGPRVHCVVASDDHLDVLLCHGSVNEPGVNVIRVSRVAEDRWHVYSFRCGLEQGPMGLVAGGVKILLSTDSDRMDPPIKALDVAQDPALWTTREETLRDRWKQNGHYRDAARLCEHKSQA